jgi:uncharacterized protein
MAEEPELKTMTRQKIVSPLLLAWGFVIVILGLIVIWVSFSDYPEITSVGNIGSNEHDNITSNNLDTSSQENITESLSSDNVSLPLETRSPQMDEDEKIFIASQAPLKEAPNENLLVKGKNGMLPVLGPDGLVSWKEYARPFEDEDNAPRIAILVTDIGLNAANSEAAIDLLPGQIDIALSPYGRNLQNWVTRGRAKGHEAFLMLPTEPLNYPDSDPGPHTLITDLNERENLSRLDWVLSQVTGYVGVVNHMGSKFTASEEALTPILNDLQNRGLMIVDARSTQFSMFARIAQRLNLPRATNNRYLDNILSKQDIRRELEELEKTATTFGAALGLAQATPLTINEIAEWAKTINDKGFKLVPVTAVANRQPVR